MEIFKLIKVLLVTLINCRCNNTNYLIIYMYFHLYRKKNMLMTNEDLLCKFRHLWSYKRPRYLFSGHLKISVVRFFLVCSFSHGSSLKLPQILSSPVQHKTQVTAGCGSIPVNNRNWTVLRNRDDFQTTVA